MQNQENLQNNNYNYLQCTIKSMNCISVIHQISSQFIILILKQAHSIYTSICTSKQASKQAREKKDRGARGGNFIMPKKMLIHQVLRQ